jgi:site-specific recombinase
MGLFFWTNNKKADAFANAVAEDLFSHIRPDVAQQHFQGVLQKNKKKQRKVEQYLESVITQMQQFSSTNSLGIYGKARLQKQFGDRLLELGYDTATTKSLVENILFRNL